MTKRDHRARHKLLHRCLDELVADWIACDPGGSKIRLISTCRIADLMEWSAKQMINPDTDHTRSKGFFHLFRQKRRKT